MKVTVITSTVGSPLLKNCLQSVQNQTYSDIQHLLVVDGSPYHNMVLAALPDQPKEISIVALPYSTGKDRYNGHRNLAAGVYLAKGDIVCFLDDDNTFTPDHIQSCFDRLKEFPWGMHWVYSFRNIIDQSGTFLCQDNCESLGEWPSILNPNDYFVDMNCYFLPKVLALAITPLMHRKFREPGQMEVDRAMKYGLDKVGSQCHSSHKYTVNYTVGNSALSVKADFFSRGNEAMLQKYNGKLPWVK